MADAATLLSVKGPEAVTTRMCDGVTLVGDVYRPEAPGRFPVLLMRQPYGRKIASTVVLAHPAWYAAHGYIVFVQDVRGRGDSEGAFRLLEDDVSDGADTLAFAAELPQSTGQVATYGFSYQAVNQLLALAGSERAGLKRPDAIAPVMGAWSVRDDWAYEGNAFRLALNVGWACQMAAEQARLAGDVAAYSALAGAGLTPASDIAAPGMPQALMNHQDRATYYLRWLEDDQQFFGRISPDALLSNSPLDLPGFFVGGFMDFLLGGTLGMYRAFKARRPHGQHLLIGPWAHLPWNTIPGISDGASSASSDVDIRTVSFLDHYLKDRGPRPANARLYDAVLRLWHDFDEWPSASPTAFHLSSGGLAATTTTNGELVAVPFVSHEDYLVHDPWRPAPSRGGHMGPPSGFIDRSEIDARSDVAVYTSAPFEREVLIAGDVTAELNVVSDRPSHDLVCTLSYLPPNSARAITLTSGMLRVADASSSGPRVVAMRATCATMEKGSRVRLSIQAAAWPAFAVNPGTGEKPDLVTRMTAHVTTLRIIQGGDRPSRLLLPLAS
jgi:putative CocE/NonD family hydrolase